MKRRPIINTTSTERESGVTVKKTTVSYRDDKKKKHVAGTTITTTVTNETPASSLKKVLGGMATVSDDLTNMETYAISVLEAAGIPTHRVKTEETLGGKKRTTSKSPVSMTEPHSNEWHAANVQLYAEATRRAIRNSDAESAVWNAMRATHHYNEMRIDRYAYTIGLERTKKSAGNLYIQIAEGIRKEQNITISELQNTKRKSSFTINSLAELVLDQMDKDDLPQRDASTVRGVLAAFYGKS